MRFFLFILLLICFQLMGHSQGPAVYDTAKVEARNFNPSRINKYKADPDFQYNRVVKPPDSLIDKIVNWFWGRFTRMMATKEGERAFNTLLFILAVTILMYFIYKIYGMSNEGPFGKNNMEDRLVYDVVDEDIHKINFEDAINESVTNRNFRFAVRLLYLQSLKNLTDQGLINWGINKTNIAYEQELHGRSFSQSFHALTCQFENNWYGNVPIDETEFNKVRDLFNDFNRQLQQFEGI